MIIVYKDLGGECPVDIDFETSYIPYSREIICEDGETIRVEVDEPVIHFKTIDYKSQIDFGTTPTGRKKRKPDWNNAIRSIMASGKACSINFIPSSNGNAMIMINEIKKMTYAND